MKKITTFLFAVAGMVMINSCSDDDDTINNGGNTGSEISGTYRLMTYTAPVGQDLNEDGESSVNLVGESTCYSDWTIILNEDHSFMRQEKLVTIIDGAISCEVDTDQGSWSLDGETLTLTNLEGSELNSEYTYLEANNSLSQTRQGSFPTIFEEVYIMENGTISLILVRD